MSTTKLKTSKTCRILLPFKHIANIQPTHIFLESLAAISLPYILCHGLTTVRRNSDQIDGLVVILISND